MRVLADGQTHTHTHTHTDANRFYNLPHVICYSYGADKNKLFEYTFCTVCINALLPTAHLPSRTLLPNRHISDEKGPCFITEPTQSGLSSLRNRRSDRFAVAEILCAGRLCLILQRDKLVDLCLGGQASVPQKYLMCFRLLTCFMFLIRRRIIS